MPDKDKQRKLNQYYSKLSSPIKSSPAKWKAKNGTNNPGLLAIQIDDSSDESAVGGFQLAPSSQLLPAETSEDEAPVEMSPVTRRRRQVARPQVLSDNASSSSEDDHIPLNLLPKKRKIVDSDIEQEGVKPKKRRILKRGLRPTAEEENVLDDLDKGVMMEQRLRKPPKKTAYQKNLERLKRQRQGLPELPSSNSESSDERSDEEIIELDSEGEEVRVKPIPGARKGDVQDSPTNEDSNSDEDEFIVDDEEGAQDAFNLPVQYSMLKAQPLVVSFKVFFQLLVHVACKPNHLRETFMKARLDGSNADAEYFKNARKQLDKHLSSIRDSQVASPIWKAEFRESLKRYPDLKIVDIESENFCHACRRISAISTRQAHLGGTPYNEDGYEPLDDSPDSSEDEDEEDGDSNSEDSESSKGRSNDGDTSPQDDEEEEEKEVTVFKLGQHCARRVALFHAFTHWEFALFQVIEEKVTAVETRNREHLMKKKKKKRLVDTGDPDNILDWLEKKGVISQQWRVVQKLMERAKTVEKRFAHEID